MTSIEEIQNTNYFTTKWSQDLLCKPRDVQNIYSIEERGSIIDDSTNTFLLTSDGYEDQHNELSNDLQLYYTLLSKSGNEETTEMGNKKTQDLIQLRELTPILIQRTDSILTTLLFITLDQNHDFRGGRTAGTDSWVIVKKPTLIKRMKLEPGQSIDSPFDNSYLSTLVNTTFSGHKSIIGLLVLNEEDMNRISTVSAFFNREQGKLNVQNIMKDVFTKISFENDGGDIVMKGTSVDGDMSKIETGNGSNVNITFLSFAQSTWDHGMHDIWHFDRPKHIYLVKLDKLTNNNGILEPSYSGHKYTTIENIIPQYETLYLANSPNVPTYVKCIENMDYSFKQDDLTNELLDRFYSQLMYQFYPNSDSGPCGQINGSSGWSYGLHRGATYKFHGLASPEEKYKGLFYELCRRLGRNVNNSIDPLYNIPHCISDQSNTSSNTNSHNLREKIDQLKKQGESINTSEVIYKQCGTVNDMNLANLDSLRVVKMLNGPIGERELFGGDNNYYDNNDDYFDEDPDEGTYEYEGGSSHDNNGGGGEDTTTAETLTSSSSPNRIKTSTSAFVLSKDACGSKISTKDCGLYIEKVLAAENPDCIEEQYPTKFQVNSGVIDSSGLGGQNMAKFFAPDIDIFMTIFNEKTTELTGAVLRLTFVKSVETNIIGTKNNVRVYSHFIYVDFDEINLLSDELTSSEWKKSYNMYPLALRQLLSYTVENTYFDISSIKESNKSPFNFILKLVNGENKKWFYYYTFSEGPSVKQINTTVTNITKKFFDWVLDNDENPVNIIVRVAQRVYAESQSLRSIMVPNKTDELDIHGESIKRNTSFEAIFLLRIKYIGDKSRATDPLFLNNNQYMEALQVTGDGNAYFTGLMYGTSTLFSTPTGTNVYFAPYMTPSGKFIKNEQINNEVKKALFQGVSPAESQKSAEKKMVYREQPIESLSSNLFNGIINPSKNVCVNINVKDFDFGSRFANPFSAMNILNGDDAIQMSSLIKKIDMINTANQVVDDYIELANDFDRQVSELTFIPQDISSDYTKKLSSKCVETYLIPQPEQLNQLSEFIDNYRALDNKVFGNFDDSFENIVNSFLNPDGNVENRNNYPNFEDSLYVCFVETGLTSLKNKCRELGEGYSDVFENVQIKQKYSELTYAFDNLTNEEKQEGFIATASKIKLDIIQPILDGLIQYIEPIENSGSVASDIIEMLNSTIIPIKEELIRIRNDPAMPSSVKEKTLGYFFHTYVEKFYNLLKSRGTKKTDKDFIAQSWPINMSYIDSIKYPESQIAKPCDPYLFGFQLLNVIRDYNNHFTNIAGSIANHKQYKTNLNDIRDKLKRVNDDESTNKICQGVPFYKCIMERIYRIYKNIVTYKDCIDKQINPPPEKPVGRSKTPSSRRGKIGRITPDTSTPTSTTLETVIEEPIKESEPSIKEPEIQIKPSATERLGRMRGKISRPDDEPLVPQAVVTAENTGENLDTPPDISGGKAIVATPYPMVSEIESPAYDGKIKTMPFVKGKSEQIVDTYKMNKLRIVRRFIDIMKYQASTFSHLLNGMSINYPDITNIQQFLTAIMMSNMNNNLYQYGVESIDKLIDQINELLQKASTLDDILDIRYNYYSFFEKSLIIESIQTADPIEFILSTYSVNSNTASSESEKESDQKNVLRLKQILRNYRYLLAFIYEYNYSLFDTNAISNYNIISKLFSELDSLKPPDQNQLFNSNLDDYTYIYIFCIKYSNELLHYITSNGLLFGKETGILDDYDEIKTILEKMGLDEYYTILSNTQIGITEKPSLDDLDNVLSLVGEKTTYFNTSNSFENAYRVFVQIFYVQPITMPTLLIDVDQTNGNENSEIKSINSFGGNNKTQRKKIKNYKEFLKTRMKHKKINKRVTKKNKNTKKKQRKQTKRCYK